MNHSNDFRFTPELSEEAARTEIVQVQFKDDPIDLFHELDVTVHELLLYKKQIDENTLPDSSIVVVWEGANGTRKLRVRRLPQSKRPWIALLEDTQSNKVLTSRTASEADGEAKSAADMLVDLAKKLLTSDGFLFIKEMKAEMIKAEEKRLKEENKIAKKPASAEVDIK